MNRFLWNCCNKFDIRIADFEGGKARNAIPREAFAYITAHKDEKSDLQDYFNEFSQAIKSELSITESKLDLAIEDADLPSFVIDEDAQFALLNSLYAGRSGS